MLTVLLLTLTTSASARLLEPVDTGDAYRGWTAQQMRTEADRLEEARPGIWFPMSSLMVGITGLSVTLFAFAIAATSCCFLSPTAIIATGIGTTASLSLITIGTVQLALGAGERRAYGAEIEQLRRMADLEDLSNRLIDNWERRRGRGAPLPQDGFMGPAPQGPAPLPLPPAPKKPEPEVRLYLPVLTAQF